MRKYLYLALLALAGCSTPAYEIPDERVKYNISMPHQLPHPDAYGGHSLGGGLAK